MRERAFAVLGAEVEGARVLDLYAGTGVVGLEALSRGAAAVVFVERQQATARILRTNCVSFELGGDRAAILVRSAAAAVVDLARRGERFDLAWADPPFENWREGLETLVSAFSEGVLESDAVACLECPARAIVENEQPGGLEVVRDLAGGASRVVMIRRTDVSR
jgi:16S rRNA (guanine(966)-N(2))-methyltransferase RsmD